MQGLRPRMYNISSYRSLMEDKVRVDAYLGALQKAVKPGDIVVDLGAGVGTWAFVSCQLGAKKVYAIEFTPGIHVARQIAAVNSLQDRIEFIQDFSTSVDLPERADVIIFDLHGQHPLYSNSVACIIDARERFLKPGGTLIPFRETVWACILEDTAEYEACVGFWDAPFHGINMRPGKTFAADWRYGARPAPGAVVTDKVCYAELDYRTLQQTELSAEVSLHVLRDCTGHGSYLWFDSEMWPGIGFSNAPGQPQTVFAGTFLPFPDPVAMQRGDEVKLSLSFRLVNTEYVWAWTTRIYGAGKLKAEFSQSTMKHYLPKLDTPR